MRGFRKRPGKVRNLESSSSAKARGTGTGSWTVEQGQPMGAAAAEATVSTSLQGEALSKEGVGETIPRLSLLLPSVPFWPNLVGSQLGREAE